MRFFSLVWCVCIMGGCGAVQEQADQEEACGQQVSVYRDADFDGYGDEAQESSACSGEIPIGYSLESGDCDDSNVSIHPDATEYCNLIDDDCDSEIDEDVADAPVWYADADEDGYGGGAPEGACSQPSGYVNDSADCDDEDPEINPSAVEECDLIDNDCDGEVDEVEDGLEFITYYADVDGDGYGDPDDSVDSCTPVDGYVLNNGDCDDSTTMVSPAMKEVCEDGIDNDCSGDDASCVFTFKGILTNVPEADLTGWDECYSGTYNLTESLTGALATCTGTHLLVGCRTTGSSTMSVIAYAGRDDVLYDTGTGNILHAANDVDWYYNDSYSWGYVHSGDGVARNSCDTDTGAYPQERVCFHTGSGSFNGGYRCGSATGLNSSTGYERVVMHADI